jgi:hypothetical protein
LAVLQVPAHVFAVLIQLAPQPAASERGPASDEASAAVLASEAVSPDAPASGPPAIDPPVAEPPAPEL